MQHKLNFTRVLMFLLLATAFPGCARSESVNVYSARNEALIKPLLDRFVEATGIEVNLVTGNADELIQRLQMEGNNSPADLLLTVDVGRLHRAKEAGVLQAVESDTLRQAIPAHYRDDENFWYGISLRSRVIVYAPDRVKPGDLSTYEALADPLWSKRLCVRSSSNIYNQSMVAAMIAHNGEARTEAWAKAIVANFARPPAGGDRDQIKAVAAGQCDVAIVNHYYLAGMLMDSDRELAEQVRLFWPNQDGHGAHVNVSGAGVTSSAKNREQAIKLLEFFVSPESQRWYADVNNEYPVREGVENSTLQQQWGAFVADTLNLAELGTNNAAAVRLMDRAGWK